MNLHGVNAASSLLPACRLLSDTVYSISSPAFLISYCYLTTLTIKTELKSGTFFSAFRLLLRILYGMAD